MKKRNIFAIFLFSSTIFTNVKPVEFDYKKKIQYALTIGLGVAFYYGYLKIPDFMKGATEYPHNINFKITYDTRKDEAVAWIKEKIHEFSSVAAIMALFCIPLLYLNPKITFGQLFKVIKWEAILYSIWYVIHKMSGAPGIAGFISNNIPLWPLLIPVIIKETDIKLPGYN